MCRFINTSIGNGLMMIYNIIKLEYIYYLDVLEGENMRMRIIDNVCCVDTSEILFWDDKTIDFDGCVIDVVTQKTGFGQRHLFVCPGCQKRVMKLYSWKYSGLYCRECSNLTYHSSQSRGNKDYYFRLEKLTKKYNIKYYFDTLGRAKVFYKPRYMQFSKWERIIKKLDTYVTKIQDYNIKKMFKILKAK